MIEIKRYNFSSFKKEYILNNETFYIWIYYNGIDEGWYMTIQDSAENTIIAGILLRTHLNLLETYRAHPNIPQGEFQLLKQSTNKDILLNYETFGTEYKLYYIEAETTNGV